jgi:hypothetical protein
MEMEGLSFELLLAACTCLLYNTIPHGQEQSNKIYLKKIPPMNDNN